jgi:hypothetical protein
MKILSTVVAVSIATSCFSASLNAQTKDVVLKPINDKVETHACYIAATKGLETALGFIQSNEPSIMSHEPPIICNGMNIIDFANKYANHALGQEADIVDDSKMVKLVAVNDEVNDASKLCVDAVLLGEIEARKKYSALGEPVFCNEKTLRQFVRSFANKNVML